MSESTTTPTAAAAANTSLASAPSREQLAQARWRYALCRILMGPLYAVCVGLMKYARGYRIKDLAAVRAQFREIAKEPGPLLICANHLTFIDSALMIWAFASAGWYFRHFEKFSWNLPAGDFFGKRLRYRLIALIAKCVFIHRDGSKEHKDDVLNLCLHLLRSGETITVFPEGKRSRSGRFDLDKMTYGVGKTVAQLGGCRVLCVYLRGDQQETLSNYPAKGSHFHLAMKLLELYPRGTGRDAYAPIVDKIAGAIKTMEDQYFSTTCGR